MAPRQSLSITTDDCRDVGGRAKHDARAENTEIKYYFFWNIILLFACLTVVSG